MNTITRRQTKLISQERNPESNHSQRKLLRAKAIKQRGISLVITNPRSFIGLLKSLGILGIIYVIATNPDKIESWMRIALRVFPDKATYSCMIYNRIDNNNRAKRDSVRIEFKISKNLLGSIGCAPVISQADLIIPLTNKLYQTNKPMLLVFVDSYTDYKGFNDFYLSKQQEAEKWGRKAITNINKKQFIFHGHKAYELTYSNQDYRRTDLGFIYLQKEYTIRYESPSNDFVHHLKQSAEITYSLRLIDNDF